MAKIVFVLWSLLTGYTIVYSIIFGFDSTLLPLLLAGQGDYFSTSFFNMMGLIPLLFFIDYLTHYPLKHPKIIFFIASFFLGGFILLPAYRDFTGHHRPTKVKAILALIVTFAISLVIGFAVIQGNPQIYFSQFFNDSLVGIMTVDWFALYALTVVIAFSRYKPYAWVSLIPIIGFGCLLVFDNLCKPRH